MQCLPEIWSKALSIFSLLTAPAPTTVRPGTMITRAYRRIGAVYSHISCASDPAQIIRLCGY